jgi:hypothetical protein
LLIVVGNQIKGFSIFYVITIRSSLEKISIYIVLWVERILKRRNNIEREHLKRALDPGEI